MLPCRAVWPQHSIVTDIRPFTIVMSCSNSAVSLEAIENGQFVRNSIKNVFHSRQSTCEHCLQSSHSASLPPPSLYATDYVHVLEVADQFQGNKLAAASRRCSHCPVTLWSTRRCSRGITCTLFLMVHYFLSSFQAQDSVISQSNLNILGCLQSLHGQDICISL